MSRWIRFFITIGLGVAAGLLYTWVINPVQYVDTTPETLRSDYKTDYVLMVAEAYQREGDLGTAIRRLGVLGESTPLQAVDKAMSFAKAQNYGPGDRATLQMLADGLRLGSPILGTPKP